MPNVSTRLRKGKGARFKPPRTSQDAVPVRRVWPDGVFLTDDRRFAKTWRVSDVNYAAASKEDKEAMFLDYSGLLNSFDSDAQTKITVAVRRLDAEAFGRSALIPRKDDGLDRYRDEINGMLVEKATGADAVVREIYVTAAVELKGVQEARAYFNRASAEMGSHLARLGARCDELRAEDKLRLLHGFYRGDGEFAFDMRSSMRRGHSFKDAVAPEGVGVRSDRLQVGGRWARVLYLADYASYIDDGFVSELTDLKRPLALSVDVSPVPTDEAVREVEKRLLGVETNITNWTRRQNANMNFNVVVPYDMEQQRKESREFLDDLVSRDQRMMLATVTLAHFADTPEQLDADTEALLSCARKHLCRLAVLRFQQLDGLSTALPIGLRRIDAVRTLTTESLAVLMPFRVQEIMDEGGVWFGENAISRNPILCDKSKLLNPNAFILGVPGSGKSFSTKELIAMLALSTDDDIIICDPEREYASLVEALGGEVVRIAAGSPHHINAMDMVEGYGEGGNPVADKSEFVLSLFEQLDRRGLGPQAKSIVDRCTSAVYADYLCGGEPPTLVHLRDKLLAQPEDEARELALSLELFTSGTLDAFAHPTNVDTRSRLLVYDIMELGRQLKTMGLLVITDAMINRVTDNWRAGKRTHIVIDEFHVVFENEYSGAFFNSAWRRFRKRNAFPTAITQNVEYLLDSVLASTMLSNSEFIVMLNQAAADREKLGKLLNISREQMGYITNADAGCGLLRYGSALVPFVNRFPKDTELYRLMTTKPGE